MNNILPSFIIKNININNIYTKYTKGFFNRPIPSKSIIKLLNVTKINQICEQKLKNKLNAIYSGNKTYDIFTSNGHQLPKGGICDYCKFQFEEEIIGYPVFYDKRILTVNDNYKTMHFFWIEGCFHSYECCLAYIKMKKDFLIDDVIMLNFMYSLIHPNAPHLTEANEPKLLIHNGGSLNMEEWLNNVTYVKSNNVIRIPEVVQYTIKNDI